VAQSVNEDEPLPSISVCCAGEIWRSGFRFNHFLCGGRLFSASGLVKNIQVIDGAENCVFDIFAATDDEFRLIFPSDEDVAFIDEVYQRSPAKQLDAAFANIWKRRIAKAKAKGINGTLYYGLERKKVYYPGRRDEEAVNPDGTRLRGGKPQPG